MNSLLVDTVAGASPGMNLERFTKLCRVEVRLHITDTLDLDLNALRSLLRSWNPVELQERRLEVDVRWGSRIFNSIDVPGAHGRLVEVLVEACATSASRTVSLVLSHAVPLLTKWTYKQAQSLRCSTSTCIAFR